MSTGTFLDGFLKGADCQQAIATDALPPGERDVLLLDPALFGEEDAACDHDHDEKIGSCGNACSACPNRGTPACGEKQPKSP